MNIWKRVASLEEKAKQDKCNHVYFSVTVERREVSTKCSLCDQEIKRTGDDMILAHYEALKTFLQ